MTSGLLAGPLILKTPSEEESDFELIRPPHIKTKRLTVDGISTEPLTSLHA